MQSWQKSQQSSRGHKTGPSQSCWFLLNGPYLCSAPNVKLIWVIKRQGQLVLIMFKIWLSQKNLDSSKRFFLPHNAEPQVWLVWKINQINLSAAVSRTPWQRMAKTPKQPAVFSYWKYWFLKTMLKYSRSLWMKHMLNWYHRYHR